MKTKTEGGVDFPKEAYAYVPDPEEPSTWKLRLWEDLDKKETAAQVGRAIAALGKGFRGNKVEIPEEDLSKVKAKVRAAWKKTHPDAEESEMPDAIKKSSRIRKLAESLIPEPIRKMWYAGEGWNPDDDDDKAMQTLLQTLQQDGYSDQVLAVLTAALADTVDSILDDDSVSDKQAQIDAALKEFSDRLQAVGVVKSKGNTNLSRQDLLQKVRDGLEKMLGITQPTGSKEGDSVTIDKSKLPEDVRKYLEDIEKRASDAEAKVTELTKGAGGTGGNPVQTEEDILKASLPEPLRKRFEEMEKQAKAAEEIAKKERDERVVREFVAKASAFKGLAVQPEEFGKVLKSLSESNPEAYAKVEDVLKAADNAMVEAGLFKEIGKGGSGTAGNASEQLENIAKSKVEKSEGKLSFEKAYEAALRENPDLYEKQKEGK